MWFVCSTSNCCSSVISCSAPMLTARLQEKHMTGDTHVTRSDSSLSVRPPLHADPRVRRLPFWRQEMDLLLALRRLKHRGQIL